MSFITSKNIALIFGITFIAAGVLGFIPNPLVSPDGFFEVNLMHNLVHLVTGGVFLAAFFGSDRATKITLKVIGLAYTGVAILGFFIDGHLLLGMVHINEADKWLHAGLALIIIVVAFGLPKLQEQSN